MKTDLMKLYEESDDRKRIDRQYMEFCRLNGCIVTGNPNVELHHLRHLRTDMFSGGMGMKPPDIMCIPLHHSLHRTGDYAIHRIGNLKFEDCHRIDLRDELKRLHERFMNEAGYKYPKDEITA